ncbi:MAG: BON domain-containing protein [Pirellulaceae bacterium]|mgnify:CR=1 FL=1|nr:BON domain-containing protein [Pirellulaceae bacterium]
MASIVQKTRETDWPEPMVMPSRHEKETVESRATRRLCRSPYQSVHLVTCDFHEGMLTLRGRVSSYYLKQIAQTAVLGMEGVEEVNNHVEVRSSLPR